MDMDSKGKKILLIEDDPTQSMMYEVCFTNSGYQVLVANSGHEGIAAARKEQPDLIFLDMVMNDMEGLEVIKALKKDPETKDLKVVVLSNLNKKEVADKSKEAGAIDFLVKMQYLPKDIVIFANKYLSN